MDKKLGLSHFIPSNNGIWQVLRGSRNNELQFYTFTTPLLKSMSNKWLSNGQTPLTPLQRCASAFFLVQSFRFYLAVRLILIEFLTAKWQFYLWQHTFEVGKEGFGKLIH